MSLMDSSKVEHEWNMAEERISEFEIGQQKFPKLKFKKERKQNKQTKPV